VKIGLISSRYPPETSPGAKRAADLVGSLNDARHEAVVLTQQPNYPDPAAFAEYRNGSGPVTRERDEAGNTTFRFRPRLAAKNNLVSRLISEARFAWRVSRPSTHLTDLDGLVASTPFVFNLAAARTYRRPMWLDVRDLTWEYVRSFGSRAILKEVGSSALRALSLSSFRAATRVSTTTERQRTYLIDRGLPADKVVVVPNGVSRAVVDELVRRTEQPRARSTGSNGAQRLVYAGLLGFPQGLSFMVESVEGLGAKDAELHLYGDGVDRAQLAGYCVSKKLERVRVHGHVDHDAYLAAIAGADILCASLRPGGEAAMPSKIWEYMAAARPILFAGRGEAAEAVERAGAGFSVEYGDHAGFQARLRELLADEDLRHELGQNGRRWVLERQLREDINRVWVGALEDAFGGGA